MAVKAYAGVAIGGKAAHEARQLDYCLCCKKQ
jgi:hypothetical protein